MRVLPKTGSHILSPSGPCFLPQLPKGCCPSRLCLHPPMCAPHSRVTSGMPLVPQILDFSLLDVSPGALKGPRLSPGHLFTQATSAPFLLVKVTTTLPACSDHRSHHHKLLLPLPEKNSETSHQLHPRNISPMCPLLPTSPGPAAIITLPLAHHGPVFLQPLPHGSQGESCTGQP